MLSAQQCRDQERCATMTKHHHLGPAMWKMFVSLAFLWGYLTMSFKIPGFRKQVWSVCGFSLWHLPHQSSMLVWTEVLAINRRRIDFIPDPPLTTVSGAQMQFLAQLPTSQVFTDATFQHHPQLQSEFEMLQAASKVAVLWCLCQGQHLKSMCMLTACCVLGIKKARSTSSLDRKSCWLGRLPQVCMSFGVNHICMTMSYYMIGSSLNAAFRLFAVIALGFNVGQKRNCPVSQWTSNQSQKRRGFWCTT